MCHSPMFLICLSICQKWVWGGYLTPLQSHDYWPGVMKEQLNFPWSSGFHGILKTTEKEHPQSSFLCVCACLAI